MENKNKGFSLVELIVVIVILAILIGVTIGGIYSYVNKARRNTDISNCKTIHTALSTLLTEPLFYKAALTDLRKHKTLADYNAGNCSSSAIGGVIFAWSASMPQVTKNSFNGNGAASYSSDAQLAEQYILGSWQTQSQNYGNPAENTLFWSRVEELFPDGLPACKEKDKVMFAAIYSTGDINNPLDVKVGTVDRSAVLGKTYFGSFGDYLNMSDKIYVQGN